MQETATRELSNVAVPGRGKVVTQFINRWLNSSYKDPGILLFDVKCPHINHTCLLMILDF